MQHIPPRERPLSTIVYGVFGFSFHIALRFTLLVYSPPGTKSQIAIAMGIENTGLLWTFRGSRKSTSGLIYYLFGSPVSWKSCIQSIVTLSSTEAEYVAMTEAVKEGIWLKHLVNQLGIPAQNIELHADSQAAIQLALSFTQGPNTLT